MNVAPRGAGTRKGHTASLALAVRRRLLFIMSLSARRTYGRVARWCVEYTYSARARERGSLYRPWV